MSSMGAGMTTPDRSEGTCIKANSAQFNKAKNAPLLLCATTHENLHFSLSIVQCAQAHCASVDSGRSVIKRNAGSVLSSSQHENVLDIMWVMAKYSLSRLRCCRIEYASDDCYLHLGCFRRQANTLCGTLAITLIRHMLVFIPQQHLRYDRILA